ncbi:hypothetical protein [Halorarius litoreus]|uniref:hypothetical protein n=1 Tax=Halorarius litoreus TaxID=2962676 RepID=UPI0020CBFD08|nr:hypothetical protein [Halorarius litoreus]
MNPPNEPGHQVQQPMYNEPPQQQPEGVPPGGQQYMPLSELQVSTPTLCRVSLDQPQEQLALGPDDHVLDSVYNYQLDTWEALVIVQPREDEDEDDE